MKNFKLIMLLFLSTFLMISCNNNKTKDQSPISDTTGVNPTKKALDYQTDQSQEIPITDSSNTIGADTLNSSAAAPNTGTNKSYNDAKANKDSSKKH